MFFRLEHTDEIVKTEFPISRFLWLLKPVFRAENEAKQRKTR